MDDEEEDDTEFVNMRPCRRTNVLPILDVELSSRTMMILLYLVVANMLFAGPNTGVDIRFFRRMVVIRTVLYLD